jgi:nitrite reductase (NADH) small subunit
MTSITVCSINDIVPNTGVCALIDNEQVAIFRICNNTDDTLYAISNFDPFSNANVLSRGIIGCKNGIITVASPIYKQLFSLETGICLDDENIKLKTWQVKLVNQSVVVSSSSTMAA